jgi:hypothetical protein
VVEDRTGRLQAFFGHVCGPRFLERLQDKMALANFDGHEERRFWHIRSTDSRREGTKRPGSPLE